MRQAAGLPPPIIIGHFAFAVAGLGIWIAFVATDAAALAWIAVGIGGLGLVAGLVAARRGWRPAPRRLIIGCLLAVIALMVAPPVGSTDMLDYAIYGRIAALGHSPYVMTPAQLTSSGDPVGKFSPPACRAGMVNRSGRMSGKVRAMADGV